MKKVFSILFALVMLLSGLQFSIDRHYCGGQLAGTKLSVTGKLASCGMETDHNTCSNQLSLDNRCCEDHLTYYRISSKYYPGYYSFSNSVPCKECPALPARNVTLNSSDIHLMASWELPPGNSFKSSLSLPEICVFRI
jgi:hypothetical protein